MFSNRYVLRREDGRYVSWPGAEHSYTRDIYAARLFCSRADAERERCGNETVEKL